MSLILIFNQAYFLLNYPGKKMNNYYYLLLSNSMISETKAKIIKYFHIRYLNLNINLTFSKYIQ
jgi:hypothetical protein